MWYRQTFDYELIAMPWAEQFSQLMGMNFIFIYWEKVFNAPKVLNINFKTKRGICVPQPLVFFPTKKIPKLKLFDSESLIFLFT